MCWLDDFVERPLDDLSEQTGPTQEVCRYCERPFYEAESDATQRGVFCSSECEDEDQARAAIEDDAAAEAAHDPRERGDDDGQEYADPCDELIERLLR